ncbi:hypothetical protein ACWC5I_02805 [Kitasatospora sp. NPDC001574]
MAIPFDSMLVTPAYNIPSGKITATAFPATKHSCPLQSRPWSVHLERERFNVDFESPKHGGIRRYGQPVVSTGTTAENTASPSGFAVQ